MDLISSESPNLNYENENDKFLSGTNFMINKKKL